MSITAACNVSGTITNNASVTGSELDPVLGNNAATEETTVNVRRVFLPLVFRNE